jgi:hypothetical protein
LSRIQWHIVESCSEVFTFNGDLIQVGLEVLDQRQVGWEERVLGVDYGYYFSH